MYVRYYIFYWAPPSLSSEEAAALCAGIRRVGKNNFVTAVKHTILSQVNNRSANATFTFADALKYADSLQYQTASSSSLAKVIAILCLVAALGAFVLINLPLAIMFIVVCSVIGLVSGGTYLQMGRQIAVWTDELLENSIDKTPTQPPSINTRIPDPQVTETTNVLLQEFSPDIVAPGAANNLSLNSEEQNELGIKYANGDGVPADMEKAAHYFRTAADMGHVKGMYNMGIACAKGRGVPQDLKQAFSWYQQAAVKGYVPAQSNLAVMLENGHGCQVDMEKAFDWAYAAATNGSPNAQRNLGAMYADGRGAKRDDVAAFGWFKRAAEQGHARAQFELGVFYELGRGTAKDPIAAIAWYRLAAEKGNENAKAQLKRLEH